MIKVNLKRTKVSKNTQETKSTGLASMGESTLITNLLSKAKTATIENLGPEVFFKIIINVILIACFPLGLKIYENSQINKLEKSKKQKEDILNAVNQKLSRLSKELEGYAHLQDTAEDYQIKKTFLKKIAENRIIIPRTLDIIQSKIPKTVWIRSLQLELLEGNMKVALSGKSFKEADINAFANSLNDILNENSIIVGTRDVKEGNSITSVEFNLEGYTGVSI